MCSNVVISAKALSKCFHIYDKPRDRVSQLLAGNRKQYYREFWALKNVSLEIKKGETVGVVGRNGSGKSTLLQMICGNLESTSGDVRVNGRISALLELGAGFNPEFTGRENVYFYGSILGLTRSEIDASYNEILRFADIGEHIEQPVKTYSSGMFVRLAFAVAINVKPDVLIVDEALAVGDEAFQRKCFARMESLRSKGVTILFVSHSAALVTELCDRAILLDEGELLLSGAPKEVIGKYQRLIFAPKNQRELLREEIRVEGNVDACSSSQNHDGDSGGVGSSVIDADASEEFFDPGLMPNSTISYQNNGAKIDSVVVEMPSGKPVNILVTGREYIYRYQVQFEKDADLVQFGMLIKTISGIELGGAAVPLPHNYIAKAGLKVSVKFRFKCNLNSGVYFFNAGVSGNDGFLHRILDAYMVRVLSPEKNIGFSNVFFDVMPNITHI